MTGHLRVATAICSAMFAGWLGLAGAPSVTAEDYILTIGGGYSPQGNQVSLEKNVLFLQRLLTEQLPRGVRHDILFSDGDSTGRDVQFHDPRRVPPANRLMAQFVGNDRYLGLEYRSHQVPEIRAGSNRRQVEQWFDEVGAKLQRGDRLLIYATAHGGKSDDEDNDHNTRLLMWNNESITVERLAERLETLPEGVNVAVVMVQCYSGGFAHLIFDEGDSKEGLASRNICGFFATVHDRVAAGCTPDIDEEDYQEYSTFFWAALGGKTRIGEPIERPDYDGDGGISLEEAHGHVIVHSDTIDIPIKTSGALLREYSKLPAEDSDDELVGLSSYDALLEHASPVDRAVLEQLCAKLDLDGSDRVEAANELAKRTKDEENDLNRRQRRSRRQRDRLKGRITGDLKERWPELANAYNPLVTELLTARCDEFIQAVESHEDYSEFTKLDAQLQEVETKKMDLDRRWVKCQRFVRVAENVALAANLPNVADAKIVDAYQRMLAAERGTFGAGGAAPPDVAEVAAGLINSPTASGPPEP